MFGAGPYWKCYARLGFDPRQNPEYRMYVFPIYPQTQTLTFRYQRTYFYIQVARNKAPVFATPEPGEEEDEPVIDKTSHEAWGAEQRQLIEEGKRPEFDHSYVPCLPTHTEMDGKDWKPCLCISYMLYMMSC
jgi:general transcription factor 3C polypeptide 5 (transcription factor C subunit 1)